MEMRHRFQGYLLDDELAGPGWTEKEECGVSPMFLSSWMRGGTTHPGKVSWRRGSFGEE